MCTTFAFIVVEYCTQSHLSIVDYEESKKGLRWTRWFKKHTYLFKSIPRTCIGCKIHLCLKIMDRKTLYEKRSLLWTWKSKELGGLSILEGQRSNLQVFVGIRSRKNNNAFESDNSGEPGDILIELLEFAPLSVQQGWGEPVWWRRRYQSLFDISVECSE